MLYFLCGTPPFSIAGDYKNPRYYAKTRLCTYKTTWWAVVIGYLWFCFYSFRISYKYLRINEALNAISLWFAGWRILLDTERWREQNYLLHWHLKWRLLHGQRSIAEAPLLYYSVHKGTKVTNRIQSDMKAEASVNVRENIQNTFSTVVFMVAYSVDSASGSLPSGKKLHVRTTFKNTATFQVKCQNGKGQIYLILSSLGLVRDGSSRGY